MGKGKGMGKYYIRKDGTHIGMDHIDRRKKSLITQAAEPKKDVGDQPHQSESSIKWYKITFKDSTPSQEVTGVSPKQLREQYSAYPIDKITRVRRKK